MGFKSPFTPRRIYNRSNICVLCGFSCIQVEISSTGERTEKKFLNKKRKLTDERLKAITSVIDNFKHDSNISTNGVCLKCFRNVEKVLQMESGVHKLQKEIAMTRRTVNQKYQLALPSPSKQVTEKRLLKSPSTNLPAQKF